MDPIVKNPENPLAELLARYDEARGVIDYVTFEPVDPTAVDKAFHERAVIAALWEIDRRLEKYAIQMSPELEIAIDQFPRISLDTDRIRGRQVSKETFLGPCYAMDEKKLLIPGRVDPFLNAHFPAGSEIKRENIVPLNTSDKFWVDGYAQAFCEPPYGIDLAPVELNELFHAIGTAVYGDLADPLDVFEWAGHWCSYFEDGFSSEWGAYLWSICNLKSGRFAVIGASTTD